MRCNGSIYYEKYMEMSINLLRTIDARHSRERSVCDGAESIQPPMILYIYIYKYINMRV